MKKEEKSIHHYSISSLYEIAKQGNGNEHFFVFNSGDLEGNHLRGRPLRSDHFTFMLLTAGEAIIKVNLVGYQLNSGSFLVIPPFSVHELVSKSSDTHLLGMGFSSYFLGNAILQKKQVDSFSFLVSQNDPVFTLGVTDVDVLETLMLLLQTKNSSQQKHEHSEEVLYTGFKMFMLELAAIFNRIRPVNKLGHTRREDLGMSFLKLLTANFKEERSVQFYADQLFVTPKHLTRMVKELTGRTCGEFIDEMVIMEAKILLNDLSLSVGNIADQLHFSDQFFFSKFFRHHTGLSPTEYKASI